ncbi:unnamed protein product [Sympodiomycopsis kandeliae]
MESTSPQHQQQHQQQQESQLSTTFTAPEGTYCQSTLVLTSAELASNLQPPSTATTTSTGTSTAGNPTGHLFSEDPFASTFSSSAAQQQASPLGNDAASSALAIKTALPPVTPSVNTCPPSQLPAAWRKGAGSIIDPTISSCSISSSSSATNATATTPDLPLIESTLVAQGIDSPSHCTTGGLGGILGMAAIASYGFLPNSMHHDPISSSSSSSLSVTSTYKPVKGIARPKNSTRQSNSTFVIRAHVHSDIKDILAQREKSGTSTNMILTQKGRTLLWLADPQGSVESPLARILFSSPPSAHDINQLTRSYSTLDVIVGFPTGDILWMDLITMRYTRINKGGAVTPSGVTHIKWLPSAQQQQSQSEQPEQQAQQQEGMFITSHVDGTMLVWDREREDGEVNKTWTPRPWRSAAPPQSQSQPQPNVVQWDPKRTIIVTRPGQMEQQSHQQSQQHQQQSPMSEHPNAATLDTPASMPLGSPFSTSADSTNNNTASQQHRRRANTTLGVTPTSEYAFNTAMSDISSNSGLDEGTYKWDKNPVVHWRVSRAKINSFAISPDLGCIAVASEDGLLRIIDLATQTLIASHASYFGAFLSLAWSTDGRFLLATSCDDLVSLYLPRNGTLSSSSSGASDRSRLLARCVGHDSTVKSASWDPYRYRDGDRTYRFGSVGEDGKLCLWDFSAKSLSRPHRHPDGQQQQTTASARPSMQLNRERSSDRFEVGVHGEETYTDVYHPCPPRKDIPTLQPISVYKTFVPASQSSTTSAPLPGIPPGLGTQPSTSPLLSVRFSPTGILLYHSSGILQTFNRPSKDGSNTVSKLVNQPAATNNKSTIGNAGSKGLTGGLTLSGTISRGMKWVGGGGGGDENTNNNNHNNTDDGNANASAGQTARSGTVGISMF